MCSWPRLCAERQGCSRQPGKCALHSAADSAKILCSPFMAGTRPTLLTVAIPKHCGMKLFSGSDFFFSDADKEQVLSLRIEPDFC